MRTTMQRIVMQALLWTLLVSAGGAAAEPLAHRSWQFHNPDWELLQVGIVKAAEAGMNRIQLSHDIVMDAEQLWEGDPKQAEWRLSVVRHAVELAHQHGMAVDLWTHELSGVPKDQFRDQPGGKVVLSPELWAWVAAKYEKLFELVPGLDGLVLTFAETDHAVYTGKVISNDPPAARIARLIEVLAAVCGKHDKQLLVRTFVYEPAEIGFMREALAAIAQVQQHTHNITVMTKCVPHDWTPYYPYNPLLGDVAGLPQVVEIDLGQEFTGQSRVLHAEVEYVKYVLDYARQKGVVGAVARIEREKNPAIGTPNEVNLFAFSRLLHDEALPPDKLWSDWAAARYGEAAAVHLIPALRRTFDITNLTFFPLEQWITNHSQIPTWGYAYGHITSRQNYKWMPSPRQARLRDELLRPTADTLLAIDHEKDLARRLSEHSLADLEQARPHLDPSDYAELKRYLELGRDNVEVFRHQQLGMFATLRYQQARDAGGCRDEVLAELKRTAADHAAVLREWADRMEQRYGRAVWPGNPDRCRAFAAEIDKRLSAPGTP